jgi:hypothetical protein
MREKVFNPVTHPRGKTAFRATHISSTDKTKGRNGCDKYYTRNRDSEEMHINVILKTYRDKTTWISRSRREGTR